MKNIYILLFVTVLLMGCDSSKKVSKEEYSALNEALSQILQPYGMTFTKPGELEEIAKEHNINLNSTMSEKQGDLIRKSIAERRGGYEFSISDTLFDVASTDIRYDFYLKIDTIELERKEFPSALIKQYKLVIPENYKIITKKEDRKGKFVGSIKLGRVLFDKSEKKAIVGYIKNDSIDGKNNNLQFVRLRKLRGEWVAK